LQEEMNWLKKEHKQDVSSGTANIISRQWEFTNIDASHTNGTILATRILEVPDLQKF
jgi:hypothetical protein